VHDIPVMNCAQNVGDADSKLEKCTQLQWVIREQSRQRFAAEIL